MAKDLNRDFSVKEVGAGVFEVKVQCYTYEGAQTLINFLMSAGSTTMFHAGSQTFHEAYSYRKLSPEEVKAENAASAGEA